MLVFVSCIWSTYLKKKIVLHLLFVCLFFGLSRLLIFERFVMCVRACVCDFLLLDFVVFFSDIFNLKRLKIDKNAI